MTVPQQALAKLTRAVQPLVFKTGIDEAPYSAAGTAFLVGHRGRTFVLTTRHSLNPESLFPICVFPSESSQRVLPLKDVFYVPRDEVNEDFVDLAVTEIDMACIADPELAQAMLIDLGLASGDWLPSAPTAEFIVLGYPEEHSFVDYQAATLNSGICTLHGRYAGLSSMPHLHRLEVSDAPSLTTFNGLSGSPIFAWILRDPGRAEIYLCGMAIRGTLSSRIIHFLDRSVLLDALNVKISRG